MSADHRKFGASGPDDKKRRYVAEFQLPVIEVDRSGIAVDHKDGRWSVLFDISLQLQKALGADKHTLSFSAAIGDKVGGATVNSVYDVIVTRTSTGLKCILIARNDDTQSVINWPPLERTVSDVFTITNFPPAFNFNDLSIEVASLFDVHYREGVQRRRFASVMVLEGDVPDNFNEDLQAVYEQAVALAAGDDVVQLIPNPVHPMGSHLVQQPSRTRRPSRMLDSPEEAPAQVVSSVRARIHTAMLAPSRRVRETIMLDDTAVKVITYLLSMRRELETRDQNFPLRRRVKASGSEVLYIKTIKEGVLVSAGVEGFQFQNRVFIPFQLDGSYVKVPAHAPWKLIADMLGI